MCADLFIGMASTLLKFTDFSSILSKCVTLLINGTASVQKYNVIACMLLISLRKVSLLLEYYIYFIILSTPETLLTTHSNKIEHELFISQYVHSSW